MEYLSQANVYSEVYSLLNSLGPKYINALPEKLYSLIEENREKSYNPTFDLTIPLYSQKISKQGTALICLLHYNYWCTSEEEKNKIKKILDYNTENAQKMYCDYEKMFNNKPEKNIEESSKDDLNNTNTAIAVKKNDTIFKKIWKFIKRIFGK